MQKMKNCQHDIEHKKIFVLRFIPCPKISENSITLMQTNINPITIAPSNQFADIFELLFFIDWIAFTINQLLVIRIIVLVKPALWSSNS